jgi:hypothetical protein
MKGLFPELSGAEFSSDRKHRFVLWRIWDTHKPKIMFICLNPSTANEDKNDPTIRRVVNFAKNMGYGGVYMTNLYSYVSTDPNKLITSDSKENEIWLKQISQRCETIVFAWGAFKESKFQGAKIIKMFPKAYALKINKDGSPRHPLYVPTNTELIRYII